MSISEGLFLLFLLFGVFIVIAVIAEALERTMPPHVFRAGKRLDDGWRGRVREYDATAAPSLRQSSSPRARHVQRNAAR